MSFKDNDKNNLFTVFVTEIDTCPRRQLDRRRIEKYFNVNNCIISASYKSADYVLLVTCGLTDANVKNALERVEKLSDSK
jgi:tRNA A37 methylthiotransferase MiaB